MLLAHNEEPYVPSRQLFGFENSLAGANREDVLNLASALADVNSEPGQSCSDIVEVLHAARRQTDDDVVRHTVQHGIEALIHLEIKPQKSYPRDFRTLEAQEDRAFEKMQTVFAGMDTKRWNELAVRLGREAAELKQSMMSSVFSSYRQHD